MPFSIPVSSAIDRTIDAPYPLVRKISASGHAYLAHNAEALALSAQRKISFRYIPVAHLSHHPDGKKSSNSLLQRCVRSASFGGIDVCHPLQTKAQIDREDQLFQLASSVKPSVAPADAGDALFQKALNNHARNALLRDPVAVNLSENFHAVFTADLTQQEVLYRDRYTPRRRSLEADAMQAHRIAAFKKETGPAILERSLGERSRFFKISTGFMYRAIDESTVKIYIRNNRICDARIDEGIGISLTLNGTYFSMEYVDDLQQHWRRAQMPKTQIDSQQRMFLLRVPIRHLLVKGFPKDRWNTGGCSEPLALSLTEHGEGGAVQCLASTREFKREYLWKMSEGMQWVDPTAACLAELHV